MSHPVTVWAIYLRISRTDDRLGVERQLDLCRLQLAAIGVAEDDIRIYDENNTSATKGVANRPEYLRLLADCRAGVIGGVMVFVQDRGWRDTDELAEFLDLALELGLKYATSTSGVINLDDEDQFAAVEIAGVNAKREVKRTRRRVTENTIVRATNGTPHGRAPFGWDRDIRVVEGKVVDSDARWMINEAEAGVIRKAAGDLLRGISLRAIVAELNAGEVKPRPHTYTKGRYAGRESLRNWSPKQLRALLLRPSNAAFRQHKGEVIGDAVWPAILDRPTFTRLQLLFADPTRRSNDAGSAPRWLLSSIATCATCGDLGRINVVGSGGSRRGRRTAYSCTGYGGASGCNQRHWVDDLDQYIGDLIETRLADPAYGAAAPEAQAEIDSLYAEIDAKRAEQAGAGKLVGKGITVAQLIDINAGIDASVAELEARIGALRPQASGGIDLPDGWSGADLLTKRAIIRDQFEVLELVPSTVHGRDRTIATIAEEVRFKFRG